MEDDGNRPVMRIISGGDVGKIAEVSSKGVDQKPYPAVSFDLIEGRDMSYLLGGKDEFSAEDFFDERQLTAIHKIHNAYHDRINRGDNGPHKSY